MSETGVVFFDETRNRARRLWQLSCFRQSAVFGKVTHCYLSFWLYEGRLAGSETDLSPMETSTLP